MRSSPALQNILFGSLSLSPSTVFKTKTSKVICYWYTHPRNPQVNTSATCTGWRKHILLICRHLICRLNKDWNKYYAVPKDLQVLVCPHYIPNKYRMSPQGWPLLFLPRIFASFLTPFCFMLQNSITSFYVSLMMSWYWVLVVQLKLSYFEYSCNLFTEVCSHQHDHISFLPTGSINLFIAYYQISISCTFWT